MEISENINYGFKNMVEIFKTNVKTKKLAAQVLKTLQARFPTCVFNFDLDDCDRILRAQSESCPVEISKIIQIAKDQSIEISLFVD